MPDWAFYLLTTCGLIGWAVIFYNLGYVRGQTAEIKRQNDYELQKKLDRFEDGRGSFNTK